VICSCIKCPNFLLEFVKKVNANNDNSIGMDDYKSHWNISTSLHLNSLGNVGMSFLGRDIRSLSHKDPRYFGILNIMVLFLVAEQLYKHQCMSVYPLVCPRFCIQVNVTSIDASLWACSCKVE
jgi:hypothetical protein